MKGTVDESKGTESRRYHRLTMGMPVEFCIPPSREKIKGRLEDAGGTGLGLKTSAFLNPRQEILIYLSPLGSETFELRAQVMWVRRDWESSAGPGYRAGCRLMDPAVFDEKKYVRFYAQNFLRRTFWARQN